MATQVSLNSGAVASAGTLALQTNGTTEAVSISTGQVATLAQNPILTSGTANGVAYLNGSKVLTTGSALVFDGTNLGVGTSSPASRIQAYAGTGVGASHATLGASATGYWNFNSGGASSDRVIARGYNSSGTEIIRFDPAGDSFINGGNLGLGVTPSAWGGASRAALQFPGGTAIQGSNAAGLSLFSNAYNNGTNDISISGGAVSKYILGAAHQWYVNSSSTAGNPVTFTQAMTLDASGNLGLGTTSPLGAFEIIRNSSSGSGVLYPNIRLDNQSATGYTGLYFINSGANKAYLEVKNDVGALTMGTGGSERMRIDSSGNLGVGTTSTTAVRLVVKGSTSNGTSNALKLIDSADADIMSMSTGGDFYLPKMGSSTGTTVVLTSGNYLVKSSSSIRYKKDVEPIDIGLNFILGLNPVKYKLKEDDIPQVGFIAEDFPDERLVSESMIDPQDKTKGFQREGVLYAQIVAPLVKAIQEQQSIIQSLTDRISALEGAKA